MRYEIHMFQVSVRYEIHVLSACIVMYFTCPNQSYTSVIGVGV